MDKLLDRFFKYISFDTSNHGDITTYSLLQNQQKMTHLLVQELTDIGLKKITITQSGYLLATLPSNIPRKIPSVALVSYMDTPFFLKGIGSSQFIPNYGGENIISGTLRDEKLSVTIFPELKKLKNKSLITSDGKSILGAANKASIAEIITAIEKIQCLQLPHGDIHVIFMNDQTLFCPLQKKELCSLQIDRAYSLECSGEGAAGIENLNIASVSIKINGRYTQNNVPYNIMINALNVASTLHQLFSNCKYSHTINPYEDFNHLIALNGNIEQAEMRYLLCNLSLENFQLHKQSLQKMVNEVKNDLYSGSYIDAQLLDISYNQNDLLMENQEIIEITKHALAACGKAPEILSNKDIFTLSGKLTELNIPCIALSNGGHNFNSRHEYVVAQQMKDAVNVLMKVIQYTAESCT